MPPRPAQKLLIVGWDAADWTLIDALFERGALPTLKRLAGSGVRADLSTLEPRLSPILWTSVATGKTADKHGVLNFVEVDPAGQGLRPVCSTTRRTKALWNILSQSGLRTNVVSWYATHPAEPIRGVVVSNLFQEGMPPPVSSRQWPLLRGSVHPGAMAEGIADLRLHPAELTGDDLVGLLPSLRTMDRADPRIRLLARQVAQSASVHNVATALLEGGEPWDCTMVFYKAIDVAGHHFMQYYPPRMDHVAPTDFEAFRHVVPGVYELQDAMLGRLLELAGPETTVILLSDHGFHSDRLRPRVQASLTDPHAAMDASWHRPLGVLAMGGPGVKPGAQVFGANLLDVAPTALALLGLPAGADMDGRALVEALEDPAIPERIFTWDAIDGDSGMNPPAEPGYIQPADPAVDAPLEVCRRETRFNLGTVYLSTRRPREALGVFEDLHREVPGEQRYTMMLAHTLYALARYADLRALIAPIVEQQPDAIEARLLLGGALLGAGLVEQAGTVLQSAERQSPDRTDLLCTLAEAHIRLGHLDEAERLIARGLGLDPTDPQLRLARARLEMTRGNLEQGVEHCLRALELRHFFPEAHYLLGTMLTWLKDYPHATRAFEVAISMQPGMLDAHRFLASIYRHLRRPMDAARHRDIAQRLMNDRDSGRGSLEDAVRDAPLGPQDWVAHLIPEAGPNG